ncbi:MAG: hypothetical protein HPY85_17705 [Anaerolineae bacterium]|nr:hypothetical protein [Anaerolineae bacterium]
MKTIMKGVLGGALALILLAGCNMPNLTTQPTADLSGVNESSVATAVEQTLQAANPESDEDTLTDEMIVVIETATFTPAPPTHTPQPTETPTPEPSPTLTFTPTVSNEDPSSWLGGASWTADFNGSVEGFYEGDDENTTIEVANGALAMTASMSTPGWHTWSMNYRTIDRSYLEAEINVKQCSGIDEYGLVFRGPDYSSGYFFAVRCNGEYSLRGYDGEYTNILSWNYADIVNTGANQSNRLGAYVDGNTIKLYINGKLVNELQNEQFSGAGHFGFLIAAYETPGFRIEIDRARYWTLN